MGFAGIPTAQCEAGIIELHSMYIPIVNLKYLST
jgi:hypothetical protein